MIDITGCQIKGKILFNDNKSKVYSTYEDDYIIYLKRDTGYVPVFITKKKEQADYFYNII